MEKDGVYIKYYKCPQCLFYTLESFLEEPKISLELKKCEYCETHPEMDSLDILHRQIEIFDSMEVRDFRHFLKRMFNHLEFKRNIKREESK